MSLFKLVPVVLLGLLPAACGTLVSGQTQKVTILTPGATESKCFLDNGIRYAIKGGESATIMRNEKDIKVDCYASGNRQRTITIESEGNTWAMGNVVTGIIPGLTFDHFSKGLYGYPEIITVDFVGVPTAGYETPSYHNKDLPNPYDQAIEYYGPTLPRQESDRYFLKNEVTKKTRRDNNPFASMSPSANGDDGITPLPGSTSTPYGTIKPPPVPTGSSAEELTRSANPTVFKTN